MIDSVEVENGLFLPFIPFKLHFKIAVAVIERMFKFTRLIYLRPLLNHLVLCVDGDYLGAEVLLKCDRDLDSLHKWLVRYSPKKQKETVSLQVKMTKSQTSKCHSRLEEQSILKEAVPLFGLFQLSRVFRHYNHSA